MTPLMWKKTSIMVFVLYFNIKAVSGLGDAGVFLSID
jgi:hypothetical protein